MTIELKMAAWTLVLAFVQIMLFAGARTIQYGSKWNAGPRDDPGPPLKPVAARLKRAQDNLFETLPLFLGAVLIAQVGGRDNGQTALGAQLYFWARVVYVPLYAFGVPMVRSLVWIISLAGLVMVVLPILF
jgi:uncharacterized MAPEG superfamily protein